MLLSYKKKKPLNFNNNRSKNVLMDSKQYNVEQSMHTVKGFYC